MTPVSSKQCDRTGVAKLKCSQEREVEPALWKSVFYRPIEEFRRRIKAASAAGEKGREPLQKVRLAVVLTMRSCSLLYFVVSETYSDNIDCKLQVKIAFGKFLQDAALFYKQLAVKLQSAYGSVGYSAADAQLTAVPSVADQTHHHHDCRNSVFRCLICLGDIYRYQNSDSSLRRGNALCARHVSILPGLA